MLAYYTIRPVYSGIAALHYAILLYWVDVEKLFPEQERWERFWTCRGAPGFPRLQWRYSRFNNRHGDVGNGILDEEGLESVGSAFSLIALFFSLVDQSLVATE